MEIPNFEDSNAFMGAHPNLFRVSFFILIFIKVFVNGRLCVIILMEDNDSNV